MSSKPWNIAVAGTGPAGLAAALFLRRLGHRVTLFDQMDEPAPLGSGLILQPTGLAVLAELGLEGSIARQGSRIDRLFGRSSPRNRTVLDVRYAAMPGTCFGIAVHRATLFQTLFHAVEAAGLDIATRFTVVAAPTASGGRRYLEKADGVRKGPFDLVVDALGTRSPLAPGRLQALPYGALWATLDWPKESPFHSRWLEQRYRRADRMVGVLPIGALPGADGAKAAFFWSLRGDAFGGWPQKGLGAWKDEVAELWPETACLLKQIDSTPRWPRPATHTGRCAIPRKLVLSISATPTTAPVRNSARVRTWRFSMPWRFAARWNCTRICPRRSPRTDGSATAMSASTRR